MEKKTYQGLALNIVAYDVDFDVLTDSLVSQDKFNDGFSPEGFFIQK